MCVCPETRLLELQPPHTPPQQERETTEDFISSSDLEYLQQCTESECWVKTVNNKSSCLWTGQTERQSLSHKQTIYWELSVQIQHVHDISILFVYRL